MSLTTSKAEQHTDDFQHLERMRLPERGVWENAFRRFRRNRLSMFSLSIILFVIVAAAVGPMMSPYKYTDQNFSLLDRPPTFQHWLGTDELGRDFLVRILLGARTAFFVAIISQGLSYSIGVIVGGISAFVGGRVDAVIMRIADVFMAFPQLLLAIFVSTVVRDPAAAAVFTIYERTQWEILRNPVALDYVLVFGSLAIASWPWSARVIRGQILTLREMDYVAAARALGGSPWSIIFRHLIPNAISPIIVSVTAGFGGAMLAEASLSFLGIGIRPPGASWGGMINESVLGWRVHPHLIVVPGLVLAVCVFAFNTMGDGLNDALNPRSSSRV